MEIIGLGILVGVIVAWNLFIKAVETATWCYYENGRGKDTLTAEREAAKKTP